MKKTLLLAAALAASACTPMLRVNVLQPAPVNFGAAKRLSVVHSEGRRSARESVITEIVGQARAHGYYQAADRSEEGITLRVAGRNAMAQGGRAAPDEIFVRVDVLDWDAAQGTKRITEKDKNGNAYTREVRVYNGTALLGITAANPQGKALLAEKEYQGKAEAAAEPDAITGAGRNAVAQFLAEITPVYVTRTIRLDDEDKAQKPIIEVAKGGNIARASEEMRGYLKTSPTSASASYNLAVLLDASGQYEEALDHYGKAISGSTKDYYVAAKADCARRLADSKALQQ